MSFKAFVWSWEQDVPNGDYHHVLLALANIAPSREVRASVPHIAKLVRRSTRKVRAALDWLATAGIILITERPGRTDIIRLNIPTNFMVCMDDDEDGDLEIGPRGRPPKTPAPSAKPLSNRSPPYADEPGKPGEPLEASASVGQADDVRLAFEAYNRMAEEHGCATAISLNDDRRRRIKARLKDCGGLDGWCIQMNRIGESPFLIGQTHHHFGLTLDFVLQPASFTKLVEGHYHDRSDRNSFPAASPDRGAGQHEARVSNLVAGARKTAARWQF